MPINLQNRPSRVRRTTFLTGKSAPPVLSRTPTPTPTPATQCNEVSCFPEFDYAGWLSCSGGTGGRVTGLTSGAVYGVSNIGDLFSWVLTGPSIVFSQNPIFNDNGSLFPSYSFTGNYTNQDGYILASGWDYVDNKRFIIGETVRFDNFNGGSENGCNVLNGSLYKLIDVQHGGHVLMLCCPQPESTPTPTPTLTLDVFPTPTPTQQCPPNYRLGSSIPLPPCVQLQLDIPFNTSSNPPIDNSGFNRVLEVVGTAHIECRLGCESTNFDVPSLCYPDNVDRECVGHAPSGNLSSNNFSDGGSWKHQKQSWNDLQNNFAIEAWIFVPSFLINYGTFSTKNNITGTGNPSTAGPSFHIQNDPSRDPTKSYLGITLGDNADNSILATTPYVFNQWNHVAVTHNKATSDTQIYMNGSLVGSSNSQLFTETGPPREFWIGTRDDNGIFSSPLGGWICRYRLYTGDCLIPTPTPTLNPTPTPTPSAGQCNDVSCFPDFDPVYGFLGCSSWCGGKITGLTSGAVYMLGTDEQPASGNFTLFGPHTGFTTQPSFNDNGAVPPYSFIGNYTCSSGEILGSGYDYVGSTRFTIGELIRFDTFTLHIPDGSVFKLLDVLDSPSGHILVLCCPPPDVTPTPTPTLEVTPQATPGPTQFPPTPTPTKTPSMTPSSSRRLEQYVTLVKGGQETGGGVSMGGFTNGDSVTFSPPFPITNYLPATLLFYIDGVIVGTLTVWQQYLTSPVLITLNIAGITYTVYSNNGVYQSSPAGFRFDLSVNALHEYVNLNFLT